MFCLMSEKGRWLHLANYADQSCKTTCNHPGTCRWLMQQMRNPRHILVLLCYWRIAGCDVFNGIPQGLGCFSMRLEPMSSMSCLSTSQHTSLWKGFTTVQQICCALWHGCSCQCQGPLTYKLEILKVNTLIFDHPFPFNLGDIWRDYSRRTGVRNM